MIKHKQAQTDVSIDEVDDTAEEFGRQVVEVVHETFHHVHRGVPGAHCVEPALVQHRFAFVLEVFKA